jgi:hypothetical protein
LLVAVGSGCGSSSNAPEAFENRSEFTDCGKASYTNARTELAPDGPVDCLKRAHSAGDEAELRVRVQGTEGDDLRWWVRSLDTGEVEVFVDQSDDPLRSGSAWVRFVCPELRFGDSGLPLFGTDICESTSLDAES